MTGTNEFVETNCTIEHEGREFTAGGGYRVDDRAMVYITNEGATDWKGNVLGTVRVVSEFRNNLTGTPITAVRVRMNDGTWWHGRYGSDWSQACRLRRSAA